VDDKKREEISVSGVDDVVMILKSDYENAYFVTGTLLYLKKCVNFSKNLSEGFPVFNTSTRAEQIK
jgi:hypothetical protein